DDVGGVAVEGDASAVVAHSGARVRVAGRFLDVAKWDPGVERGGDEGVPQGVGTNSFGDPGSAGDTAHDPAGGVAFQAAAVGTAKDRSFASLPDCEVDGAGGPRCERDGHDLAALTDNREGAVAAFEAETFDVGPDRFRDAQAVEREQRYECVVAGVANPGRDQHGADLVAIQAGRVGLVVQ